MVLKKVLLIGINYYNTNYSLQGCINDILDMEIFLRNMYPECNSFKVLHDGPSLPYYIKKPSKENILDAFDWILTDLHDGDSIYIHYSGHGGIMLDDNNDERTNIYVPNMDSFILSCYKGITEIISDDEIRDYLVNRVPCGVKCIAVFDSCRNGSILDLRYSYRKFNKSNLLITNTKHTETYGNVISISTCYDNQSAYEYINQYNTLNGIGTWALINTWRKYGKYFTLKQLIEGMQQFFIEHNHIIQTPQLSTGKFIDINQVMTL
jgi:hypothetical protein